MTRLLFASIFASLFAAPAFAGQYMSAHSCQPYQHGGLPNVAAYYQNQGSILAVADTQFMCPVPTAAPGNQQHVKVYYASAGVALPQPVSCRFWKITAANLSMVSPVVSGSPNQNAAAFDIYSPNGSADTIGYNLECTLKRGGKILGYYVF